MCPVESRVRTTRRAFRSRSTSTLRTSRGRTLSSKVDEKKRWDPVRRSVVHVSHLPGPSILAAGPLGVANQAYRLHAKCARACGSTATRLGSACPSRGVRTRSDPGSQGESILDRTRKGSPSIRGSAAGSPSPSRPFALDRYLSPVARISIDISRPGIDVRRAGGGYSNNPSNRPTHRSGVLVVQERPWRTRTCVQLH